MTAAGAIAIAGDELELGGGLLALLRPALLHTEPGGVVALLSRSARVAEDLPSWCRSEGHDYLGRESIDASITRHLVRRGPHGVPSGARETGMRIAAREGKLLAADVLSAVPMPPVADAATGFAPRGAQVEPGGPVYPFSLVHRDAVAPPEIATLYDQAVAAQWDAARDIPWSELPELAPALESAIAQVMTFLAENELSALWVPSRFIARLHPAFVEVAMFLSMQLADESRHIDVFLKRARAGGAGLGVSSAVTSASLSTLLQTEDFTESAFLLSVLGEGTFLDLLRFIEEHAPDPVTAEIVRRARLDEARHVHFGLAHVGHALRADASLYARLEASVRRRSATLAGVGGVPAPLQDALTVLAAGGTEPRSVARGHDAFRALLETMHESRTKRLQKAGFSAEQAATLSDLHTPNFM